MELSSRTNLKLVLFFRATRRTSSSSVKLLPFVRNFVTDGCLLSRFTLFIKCFVFKALGSSQQPSLVCYFFLENVHFNSGDREDFCEIPKLNSVAAPLVLISLESLTSFVCSSWGKLLLRNYRGKYLMSLSRG